MNIWIAILGGNQFTEANKLGIRTLLQKEFDSNEQEDHIFYEYKTPFVHYLSFQFQKNGSQKVYHHTGPENELTAYSGLLVGKKAGYSDYRSAESIQQLSRDPVRFSDNIFGHFSVIRASESELQCFVDTIGLHKVFYYEAPDNQIYLSNFIDLIKLFKKPQINYSAFLDWIILESALFRQTEETGICSLSEYGLFTWNPKDGMAVSQYQKLSDIFYNSTPRKLLFDKTVSGLKTMAEYLSTYHNCIVSLSGGYDTRLVLSSFWQCDKSNMESYTFAENYDDIPIAKQVARDHSITHRVFPLSEELPELDELHEFFLKHQFPFLKYSKVFNYLVAQNLQQFYRGGNQVLLKGTGGNPDRRILEYDFLDEFEEEHAIQKLTEYLLREAEFLNRDAARFMKQRVRSYYQQKYLPVITGRGKNHKLKCILFKERFGQATNGRNTQIHPQIEDWLLPLLMDSFQALFFNGTQKELIRSKKNSLYHQLFQSLTNGQDRSIHFTSGMHWDAGKFSRGFYRLHKSWFEKKLKKRFPYKEKHTRKVKSGFFRQHRGEFLDVLTGARNSVLWDYLDRDLVLQIYRDPSGDQQKQRQIILKKVIPFLRIEDQLHTRHKRNRHPV